MVASYITTAKKPRTITIHKSKQIPLSDNNVTIKLTCTSEKKTKVPQKPLSKSNHLHHQIFFTIHCPPPKKKWPIQCLCSGSPGTVSASEACDMGTVRTLQRRLVAKNGGENLGRQKTSRSPAG